MSSFGMGRRMLARLLGAFVLVASPLTSAWASSVVSVEYLRGKQPAAPDAITALGTDLFGDKVNLYNGALSFEQTDFSIPGNSSLPVAVVRQHSPGRSTVVRGVLADWDLNTPRIEGTFAHPEGWDPDRCTNFRAPRGASRSGAGGEEGGFVSVDFDPWEINQGMHLIVPGAGSQELLFHSGNLPHTDPAVWRVVTRNAWRLSCLPALLNGPGQGFLAQSPDGTLYRFNWLAQRQQTWIRKGTPNLARRDWMLMATEVRDRFGNWVRYSYNPAAPLQLTRIDASDGRVVTLAYAGGRLVSAADGERGVAGVRVWQYQYGSNGDLQHVVLPDSSRWTFDLRPLVGLHVVSCGTRQPHLTGAAALNG